MAARAQRRRESGRLVEARGLGTFLVGIGWGHGYGGNHYVFVTVCLGWMKICDWEFGRWVVVLDFCLYVFIGMVDRDL